MFAAAFSSAFAGRAAQGAGAGFASAFAGCFAGLTVDSVVAYVGPMRAQQLLTDGAAWAVVGSGLYVAGKRLIGPAGKVFAFASPATADKWARNAGLVGLRERQVLAEIEADTAAAWKARKRDALAIIAGRVVDAAARASDDAKRAALIDEANYCFDKWGV